MGRAMDKLWIYNSLSHRKEEFKPIEPGKVKMYVCGMTVYDFCHAGHGRMLVVFDIVARYFRWLGYELTYVRNITDIDDKIILRAREKGVDFASLTAQYIEAMHEDLDRLHVLRPDFEPRATHSIDSIKNLIQVLLEKGFAYLAPNGDVYFSVSKFGSYGSLSGKNLKDLKAGSRVEINSDKSDPLDFVLWKAKKTGEPSWNAPWGAGRPGWHIECSAMSMSLLGNHFDIHGGGQDLLFPHHENEIAQSEAATCEHFVNYWMHNGHVRINNEKMAKSLGNFFTLRDVFQKYQPEVFRYFVLTSHYRSPLNYSEDALEQAQSALDRLYTALLDLNFQRDIVDHDGEWVRRFQVAMNDDFNTPEALSVLHEMATEINRYRSLQSTDLQVFSLAGKLWQLGQLLGLFASNPEEWFRKGHSTSMSENEIESLIDKRQKARQDRDFATADALRDYLFESGIILEDYDGGTRWRSR